MDESHRDWLRAARAGSLEAMRALHDAATPKERLALVAAHEPGASSSGHTALHWAAAGGHAELAAWLLSLEGVDVGAVNNGGSTPLHSAAAHDRSALVSMLLDPDRAGAAAAACAAARDTNGDTPFAVAAARGHEASARLLARAAPAPPHGFLQLSIAGTPAGMLVFALHDTVAPRAVANWLGFASGTAPNGMCYRGTSFHRLLPGQVLQGGQFRGGAFKGSIFGGPFADERAGLSVPIDRAGLLCMANAGPNTNGSQFFVTLAPCDHLSGGHVTFGRLVAGSAVLEAAALVPADEADRPAVAIAISDCGRWPPPAPWSGSAAAAAAAAGAAAPAAVSLGEVSDAASAKIGEVASAVAQGLKRAREEGQGAAASASDGTAQPSKRATDSAPASNLSRWDAALGGLSDDDDDSDEEGG